MAPFLQTSQLSGCIELAHFVQQREQNGVQGNLQVSPCNTNNSLSQQLDWQVAPYHHPFSRSTMKDAVWHSNNREPYELSSRQV